MAPSFEPEPVKTWERPRAVLAIEAHHELTQEEREAFAIWLLGVARDAVEGRVYSEHLWHTGEKHHARAS